VNNPAILYPINPYCNRNKSVLEISIRSRGLRCIGMAGAFRPVRTF
jgi:hypothetical protein